MLDKDDAKKLATAALVWKFFFSGRKSSPSLPPADPSYRPRYFRRWFASLIILSLIGWWALENPDVVGNLLDNRHNSEGEFWLALLGLVGGMVYLMLAGFFVLWTIKKVLLTILGIFAILFRKIF